MWYNNGYAESLDGITNWNDLGSGILPSDSNCPFVMKDNGIYYLFTSSHTYTQLDLYTSVNGRTFTIAKENIIPRVPAAWHASNYGNVAGIVQNRTLYLFVEATGAAGWEIGLFTSPDFLNYTDNGSNPRVKPYGTITRFGGPTLPYYINGKWWMWVHGMPEAGLPSDIYRFTAAALTDNWTMSPQYSTIPRAARYEGVGEIGLGQVSDPYILEVNGKTYCYFGTNNDGSGLYGADHQGSTQVAIYDGTMSALVQTDERVNTTTTTTTQ